MKSIRSLRPFLGADDFDLSRQFYLDLGFSENRISTNMSYFSMESVGFYLQDASVRDWIDNSMLFLEVEDTQLFWEKVKGLELPSKYRKCRLSKIKMQEWGNEFFLHDPAGILWHIGQFDS
ncbi:MAG: glyoxalase [Bacteroidetes bacterium]|nr:glyoxalase [Bacteroidota bacterium]